MAARTDPLRNFHFRLEIDDIQHAGFSEVAIGETTLDPIDFRQDSEPPHVRKLSGLNKSTDVTLKRGVATAAGARELLRWHKETPESPAGKKRRRVAIVVMDESGTKEVARLGARAALLVKFEPGDLNGKGNEVMIELLELANEGITRIA
jgi:phage tail-like protein